MKIDWLRGRQQAADIRQWLVDLFAGAIKRMNRPDDRAAAIRWLGETRKVVASDRGTLEKLQRLQSLTLSRDNIRAMASRIADAASAYRSSNMPLAMKVAIPATIAAIPFLGGQAAGVAAFGGALGVPVLLLFFLGVSGITSIIEAVVTSAEARVQVAGIMDVIIEDERLRRASAEMKAAMAEAPADPRRADVPPERLALQQYLLSMDPFAFEQHVMSFFQRAGHEAWVTRKSNDFGVDGFAVHDEGLIIVQCKRNALSNRVGRPAVQQFKGAIEEQGAFRGYIVTTSDFTQEAIESAAMTDRLRLIPMETLAIWHDEAPQF